VRASRIRLRASVLTVSRVSELLSHLRATEYTPFGDLLALWAKAKSIAGGTEMAPNYRLEQEGDGYQVIRYKDLRFDSGRVSREEAGLSFIPTAPVSDNGRRSDSGPLGEM
jgi:hypothetical protein